MAASLDGLLGQSLGLPALWQINIVVVQIELESENELRVAQLCLHGPVADEKIQLRCHRKHGAGVLRVMAVFYLYRSVRARSYPSTFFTGRDAPGRAISLPARGAIMRARA